MPYLIKSQLTVEVEIEVDASSEDEAQAMFDSIGVTARLFDVDPERFDVIEDSVSDVDGTTVEKI